jgi:hypothetical protein
MLNGIRGQARRENAWDLAVEMSQSLLLIVNPTRGDVIEPD